MTTNPTIRQILEAHTIIEHNPPGLEAAVIAFDDKAEAAIYALLTSTINKAYKKHLMNPKYTSDYQNAFINGLQAMKLTIESELRLGLPDKEQ